MLIILANNVLSISLEASRCVFAKGSRPVEGGGGGGGGGGFSGSNEPPLDAKFPYIYRLRLQKRPITVSLQIFGAVQLL